MRCIRFSAPLLLVALCACSDADPSWTWPADPFDAPPASVVSLSGQTLSPPDPVPGADRLEADLAAARANLESTPDDPDALIWVARRLGYLWRYPEAIAVLDEGIERWPDDPRLHRHRGHRHITMRDFESAQADLERAARLIAGKPDEIEPDGAPNPAGIPRTTLAYNIWYHLGLARFLQADYEGALEAYVETMKVSGNDDAIVATTDWMWMALMRLDRREEAAALLATITPDMDLLENDGYHRRLLMYQGVETPEALLDVSSGDATAIATQGYGVANYRFVNGDTEAAKAILREIVAGPGWNAFGHIAAEADLQRMEQAADVRAVAPPKAGANALSPSSPRKRGSIQQ